jgi:hypothetical protein
LLNEFLNRSRAYKDLKEKFEKCAIPKVCWKNDLCYIGNSHDYFLYFLFFHFL